MSAVLSPSIRTHTIPPDWDEQVIRLGPFNRLVTDDEFFKFCQLNRSFRIELTKDGEVVIMLPVGSEGSHRNFKLTGRFAAWEEADGTGIGFDSSAGFKLPNGAKRSPDLAWIRRERWEAIPKKQRKKFAPICPDFVVELRSESDRLETLQRKIAQRLDTQSHWHSRLISDWS